MIFNKFRGKKSDFECGWTKCKTLPRWKGKVYLTQIIYINVI